MEERLSEACCTTHQHLLRSTISLREWRATMEKNMRDRRLRPFLSQARIDCELFEYKCPLSWGALVRLNAAERDGADVRHCNVCDRHVFLVTNEEELINHAAQRHCVAVIRPEEVPNPSTLPHTYDDEDDDDNVMMTMGVLA